MNSDQSQNHSTTPITEASFNFFQKKVHLREFDSERHAMDGYGSSDGSADFEDLDDDEVWRAEDDGKGWVMGGAEHGDHRWLYTLITRSPLG